MEKEESKLKKFMRWSRLNYLKSPWERNYRFSNTMVLKSCGHNAWVVKRMAAARLLPRDPS